MYVTLGMLAVTGYHSMISTESKNKFLVVQWLGLCASSEGDIHLILGQGTKILSAMGCSKK